MEQQEDLFSNRTLAAMIIPLFLEQLLVMLVGLADTLTVSYAGEAAVSGVSLVNQFNTIFIYLFTALASGGAVVISQYIGKREHEEAGKAADQLLTFSVLFSVALSVVVLIFNEAILRLMFGKVEPEVMQACITYLRISAYSYPALAVYNAGAAVYRSLGKTSVTMYLSILSNVINIVGNITGVFVLKAGVAGVAYPSLIARTFSAVVITCLCFGKKRERFLSVALHLLMGWEHDEAHFKYRGSKRSGKRHFPARESGTQQYCCTFWHLSDRGKRRGTEYLVDGGIGGCFHGTCFYHGHRTVHGKKRYRSSRFLFQKADEDHVWNLFCMESSDFSGNTGIFTPVCAGNRDKTACHLACTHS